VRNRQEVVVSRHFPSRRDFVKWSAAAGGLPVLAGCTAPETGPQAKSEPVTAPFTKDLGAQLYTVRSALPDKTKETLQSIAAIGYKEVEILQTQLETLPPLLIELGLKPVSMHLDSKLILDNDDPVAALSDGLSKARSAGISFVVMPYIPSEKRGGLDVYRALALKLNKTGQAAKEAGLRLCYHNHAFEYEPREGSTAFDILMKDCEPSLVALEIDVFWVSVAGRDPVEMLQAYSGRTPLVHLKDKSPTTPQQFKEGLPPESLKKPAAGHWTSRPSCAPRNKPAWSITSSSRIKRQAIRSRACGKAISICGR
jgi:sugar phosphate isomerase/epimerase